MHAMTTELAAASAALRDQWDRIRAWVGEVVDHSVGATPSVLPGWTVAELVAHLGRALDALAHCTPLPPGTVPLTLGEYVGTYPGRAAEIAPTARDIATEIADDPLAAIDRRERAAFATLRALGPDDTVVQARRGPVLLSTMVVSRVLELVVHGDDLLRSVERAPLAGPAPDTVDPGALDLVARELLAIVVARGGWDLELVDARAWVRVATGREPYSVGALTAALRAAHPSDALPDLGRMLPLL
jgi:uncharacterized protein (TIGR03083 family)